MLRAHVAFHWLPEAAANPVSVLAHPSHWLAQAIYLAPLVVLVLILVVGQLRERRGGKRASVASGPGEGTGRGIESRDDRLP